MTKLKTIEERAESVFTVANLMAQPRHLVKEAITNDRQAIREVLRERFEDYIPPFSADRENPLKHCYQNEGYAKGIEDALAFVDELLGGAVTE